MIDCIDEQLTNYHNNNNNSNNNNNNRNNENKTNSNYYQKENKQQQLSSNMTQQINQNLYPKQEALLPVYSQQQRPPQHHFLLDIPQETINTTSNSNNNNSSISMNSNQQQGGNELIGYYFGSISRETAEWILKTNGNQLDGSYLLRSSGPNDDFVLSLMVVNNNNSNSIEVLHYKIVETEDSFVALHGQVGDEKFATIDELIEKAQGVATKPKYPINRQSLDSQILPPTYWGLTVDQVRLAILIKAKQWGFPLLSSLFQNSQQNQNQELQQQQQFLNCYNINNNNKCLDNNNNNNNATTLNNETIRTLIYKSLHEFQPWFHGKISREEAERRISEDGIQRDGKFLVRERDNYSYAMCICHKKTIKHYRIDVLPTGELAIQDGRKFTSLMALISHYTIMSDGLWCALTEACSRPVNQANISITNTSAIPIIANNNNNSINNSIKMANQTAINNSYNNQQQNLYCIPPKSVFTTNSQSNLPTLTANANACLPLNNLNNAQLNHKNNSSANNNNQNDVNNYNNKTQNSSSLICANQGGVNSIKVPIKEWLQNINQKWSQLIANKNQHQSLNSFLFGSQNPLNNHCRHNRHNNNTHHNHHHHHHHHHQKNSNNNNIGHSKRCKNGHTSCACLQMQLNSNFNCLNNNNNSLIPLTTGIKQQDAFLSNVLPANYWNNLNNICPTIKSLSNNNPNVNIIHRNSILNSLNSNIEQQNAPTVTTTTTNTLLSCLPQNSGFTLNSQSFIGSPLFAVKPNDIINNNKLIGTTTTTTIAGAHKSGFHRGDDVGFGDANRNGIAKNIASNEDKLISPAQSIAADLNTATTVNNNPYSFNNDIYGSQTSTLIINDRLPTTSSSSSSGGCHQMALNNNNKKPSNAFNNKLNYNNNYDNNVNNINQQTNLQSSINMMIPPSSQIKQSQQQQHKSVVATPRVTQQMNFTNHAGLIKCGQHAGPAYRYTNCQDENSIKPCYHRQNISGYDQQQRAIDDLQLITPSTQLSGPAALTKFVQFQDGQCLRTHRDTRSIQLAYLSSKQFLPQQSRNQLQSRELNNHQYKTEIIGNNNNNNNNNSSYIEKHNDNNQIHSLNNNNYNHQNLINNNNDQFSFNNCRNRTYNYEIDLMDCSNENNNNDDEFDFKYDPKLIKSSSIETLCGGNDDFVGKEQVEQQTFEDFSNFKTNSELLMSLQSCWVENNQYERQQFNSEILNPTTTTTTTTSFLDNNNNNYNGNYYENNQNSKDETPSILNSQIPDGSQIFDNNVNNNNNETYDHMKKKHDLDEVTTAILAELTASLKAQVDLKNKRSGLIINNNNEKSDKKLQNEDTFKTTINIAESNPIELVNEFDTMIQSNNKSNNMK